MSSKDKKTDQEARLRLFLAEYERVCKRYSLTVINNKVFERTGKSKIDCLPIQIEYLKQGGINA